MYKSSGLVPSRFLILIAHFSICVNLLWTSQESLKFYLMDNLPELDPSTPLHPIKLKIMLSITVGLICFEFIAFILGFTLFNTTSALLSIGGHVLVCLTTTLFVMDKWQCEWFWWIFTFGSILPTLYDIYFIIYDISVEQPGWSKLLVLAGITTILGSSTPVGYAIGVINTPATVIRQFCNESSFSRYNLPLSESKLDLLWACIVTIFLIGGTIGSLTGSLLADRIGRRGGLIVSSVLGVISGILFWSSKGANSIELLFIGRFIIGLSAGLTTTIMPMYLIELAPPRLKGAIGAFCPLGVTVGVLLGQILSMYRVLGNENNWSHCLAFSAILQAICALIIPVLPESPKYLFVIRKKPHLALKQLKRIRNTKEEFLSDEIEILRLEEQENLKQGDTWSIKKVLKSKSLFLPLLLVCALQAGQQLSGVNAVFYYSTDIFKSAGLSVGSSEWATIGTGLCNIFMALLSIVTMSCFKRRAILQLSLVLSGIFLIILGLSIGFIDYYTWMPYLCIVGVLGYVLCYGLGLGPIPYFVGSELFEVGPRSIAMALGSMANWIGNCIVGLTFPTVKAYIGATSFFIFAAVVAALLVFVRIYLPETKGRDACEIYHLVEHGFKSRPLSPQSLPVANGKPELSNLTEKTYM